MKLCRVLKQLHLSVFYRMHMMIISAYCKYMVRRYRKLSKAQCNVTKRSDGEIQVMGTKCECLGSLEQAVLRMTAFSCFYSNSSDPSSLTASTYCLLLSK